MRKFALYIIGIVIIGIAIVVANIIIKNKTVPKPEIPKVVKLAFTEIARNETVPISIPSNGSLIAKNRLELFSEVQGVFISSAHDFKSGQHYTKGQTLIRLDASEYYASVQSSKSELYNLITSIMPDLRLDFPEAFQTWQRYLNDFDMESSVKPLPEMSDEKVKFFISGRGIVTSYYRVKNLEQRLSKYTITAPFSGILTEALVTKGTLVRPGQKLGEFIDDSVYEVELAIGKSFGDLLKLGESVELRTLEGEEVYNGTVARINGKIDQATQTVKVFVEVKGEDLKEGQYLEAQLNAKNEPDAMKISRKLLVNDSEIFIVRDTILDKITVNPVYFSANNVVVKGIPDGTEILTSPIPGAYPGMLVKANRNDAETEQDSSQLAN